MDTKRGPPYRTLIFAFLGIGGLVGSLKLFPGTAEVQIGMVIVIALSVLITLMFLMTTGFAALGLANSRQALALPPGSIRAMIALFLILVFVILSIYLFTTVAEDKGGTTASFTGLTSAELTALGVKFEDIRDDNGDGKFDGKIRNGLPTEGRQMAQQLVTILGTLAAAVSAFYFGSTSVAQARAAVTPRLPPVIGRIDPQEGQLNSDLTLSIFGRNLETPKKVRLVRGNEEMPAREVFASNDEIRCKVRIDKDAGEPWDVAVETEDGLSDRLSTAFTVTAEAPPAQAAPVG